MFLEKQNQFDPQHLEAPYAQAYADFALENQAVLYTWGKEDLTQRFTDYLAKKVEKELLVLIDASPSDEAKKKELLSLAKRQQLLLVSTDEGKTFNQLLTLEEAKAADPLKVQVFSPTLRSTTLDLAEVIGEQTLLHTVSTINENFTTINGAEKAIWSVKNASVEKGVVHVEVSRTARNPEEEGNLDLVYEVEVDQDPNKPLDYKQIDNDGKEKHVSETQLFDEYGEAKADKSLQGTSQETLTQAVAMQGAGNNPIKDALLSTSLTMLAMQEAASHASPEQRAREAAAFAQSSMEQPLMQMEGGRVPNVMAAKAAMAARFARQTQALQQAQQHEAERAARNKKIQEVIYKQEANIQKTKKARWSADQKNLAKGAGVGAGMIGGLVAALTGSSLFVTHVTLFT